MLLRNALKRGALSGRGLLRRFSVGVQPTASPVTRGKYPAYTPILAEKSPSGPPSLSPEQALAITETVNSVLELGVLTHQRFKTIAASDFNPAVKFQLLMEAIVEVQLYAALPYGFESTPQGFQDFSMALSQMNQQVTDPTSTEAKELQQVFSETWEIAIEQVFGAKIDKQLSLPEAQAVAVQISTASQDPEFLKEVESKVKPLPLEQKQLAIEEMSYEIHEPIMESNGLKGESGYVQLKVQMMQHMGDPQVQMNLFAAQRAIGTRAGLM